MPLFPSSCRFSCSHVFQTQLSVPTGTVAEDVGGVAEAETDRMKPELHNGCIVELVYLASHGDEAVAVLNFLNILLSGCLCGYLTQHCLGE